MSRPSDTFQMFSAKYPLWGWGGTPWLNPLKSFLPDFLATNPGYGTEN